MNFNKLLSELEKLNLPKDKFAITSSGPMGIRNIREIGDLDIIVYPEIWAELTKKYKIVQENELESIYIGNIQILGKGSLFNKIESITDQIDHADIINEYRYVRLDNILKTKKIMSRPKDINDVKLIEEYLSKNQNE